jgi:exodeoxyribonuclease V alpha subunit
VHPNLWPDVSSDADLSDHQKQTIARVTSGRVGILTGSPGTGKSFSAAAIVRRVVDQYGENAIRIAAPTGKAAVRMTQAMKNFGIGLQATTMHRLLEIGRAGHDGDGWDFQRNRDNPLCEKFFVIDEFSMVDTSLAADFFDALADGSHVLILGDTYQLPPVGHGAPLRDLIEAGVPAGELTEVRRNAGMIVHGCLRIKNGESFDVAEKYVPELGHNLRHFDVPNAERALEVLDGILTTMKAFDPVWATQVIVGTNTKSDVARVAVNRRLKGLLNPHGKEWPGGGNPFRVSDKIICLKNTTLGVVEFVGDPDINGVEASVHYQPARDEFGQPEQEFVANGEIGRVVAIGDKVTIARMSEADVLVRIPVKKKSQADDDGDDADDSGERVSFDHAYAVTCHRMQGSESPCVIVMADQAAGRVADRSWWYTAVSRAKQLCVIIGPKAVIDRQRVRHGIVKRKTFLVEELKRLQSTAREATE